MNDRFFGGNGMNGLFGDEDMDMEESLAKLMMMNAMLGGGMPGMEEMMGHSFGAIKLKIEVSDPETAAKIEAAVKKALAKDEPVKTDDPRLFTTMARLSGEQNVVKSLEGYVSQLVKEKAQMKECMGKKDELFEKKIEAYDKGLTSTREELSELMEKFDEAEEARICLGQVVESRNEVIRKQDNALQTKETEYSELSAKFSGAQLSIASIKTTVEGLPKKPQIKDYKAAIEAIMQSITAHEEAMKPVATEKNDDSVNTQENAA